MAIEQNVDTGAPAPSSSTFSGATLGTQAPSGSMDFLSLLARGSSNRIDAAVEPYLEKIRKATTDRLKNIELTKLERTSNGYAFIYKGPDAVLSFFGILFVSTNDPVSQNFLPPSAKFRILSDEIQERWKGQNIRIAGARIVLAGYGPDLDKADDMADTIIRTFNFTAAPDIRNATIKSLVGTEFSADWRISEAKAMEARLSSSGVRPRMDIGLTLKAKIRNELSREFRELADDYRPLGVIGGYTEIREKELRTINGQNVMLYTPVFVITVLNAEIPLEGVGMLLLAALAPTIYNTMFWANQYSDLGEGKPQPGLLELDEDNRNKPVILKDREDLLGFIRARFATPIVAFELQDGGDIIPGMERLAVNDPNGRQHLMNRLTNFFGTDQVTNAPELSRQIELRYDGVYGDTNGVLMDSRNIDYLHVANHIGIGAIDHNMRRILLGGSDNPVDRARIVSDVTHSFYPVTVGTVVAINPDFIKWVVEQTQRNHLVITDPNAQLEARPFQSILDGFGNAAGMGSIVTNSISSRSAGISSFWA